MVDKTGDPIENGTNRYAEITDVQDILRSFSFTDTSNPTKIQVKNIIDKKTRFVEKELPTAFRLLEIKDLYIDVEGSSKQKRKGISSRTGTGLRHSNAINNYSSSDKWVKIHLPHYFIDSLDELTLYSSTGSQVIDLSDPNQEDRYRLKNREGELLIDYRSFPNTSSGTAGSDRMIDTEIKVSYTYGKTNIEKDITEAVSKFTVYELINSDAFSELRSEEDSFVDLEVFTSRLKEDAEEILENYKY